MKIHLLWDFLTGSILQLRIAPGHERRYQPDRPGGRPGRVAVAVRPGLLLSGWFQNLTRAGAFWISRLQHGTSVSTPRASLGTVAILRQQTGSGPIDVSVLLGVSIACLPIDRSAGAPRGGRPEATESLREGPEAWPRAVAGVSRMAGLDDLRDQLRAGVAEWEAVVVLYRARWQIELMFKLWKWRNGLATHRAARPRRSSWRWFTSS